MYGNGGSKVKKKTELAKFVENAIANLFEDYDHAKADPQRGIHPDGVAGYLKFQIQ